MNIDYQGRLHCIAQYAHSKEQLDRMMTQDSAPQEQDFSPTNLIATALGSGIATNMGLTAEIKGLNLTGLSVDIVKHMATDWPHRITRLSVTIRVPLDSDHPSRQALIDAANACPVHRCVSQSVEVPIEWVWGQQVMEAA